MADDIIITAKSNQEHDHILTQVLERAKDHNIVFNLHKLQLQVNEVKYLGTIVTPEGTKPDPSKVRATGEMTSSTDKADIRCLLGMINFLATHCTHPEYVKYYSSTSMSCFLKSDVIFEWEPEQDTAVARVKKILSSSPTLCYFDPTVVSTIQADASQSGLKASLL